MDTMVGKKELRNFGLMVGGIFFLIGVWPMIRYGEGIRLWAIVPGSLLVPFQKHSVLINLENAKNEATAIHEQLCSRTHLSARHLDTYDRQTSQFP